MALAAARLRTKNVSGGGGGGSYSAAVLADSPLGYWRLGEPSGTTMTDSSGNSHDGTYTSVTLGTTGLLTGDSDTAATFNGTSSFGGVTGAAWMDSTAFTIEAIFKPSGVTGTQVIAARQSAGTGIWTFRIEGNALKFYYWDGGGTLHSVDPSYAISAGTKYHAAVTFTAAASMFIYVGGTQVATTTVPSIRANSAVGLTIGASGAGEYLGGVIDEPAFYGSALSGTRIAAHAALV